MWRSSNGKSNSVASICVVSSIETRSTQLNVSLRGRASRILPARSRMMGSSSTRRAGLTAGVTALRCSSCIGGSMAMNIGGANSPGASPMTMSRSDENDVVAGLDLDDVVELGDRPIGAEVAVGAVVHGVFAAQPCEIVPMLVALEQLGSADVDLRKRHGPGVVRGGRRAGCGRHRCPPIHLCSRCGQVRRAVRPPQRHPLTCKKWRSGGGVGIRHWRFRAQQAEWRLLRYADGKDAAAKS